MVSLAWQVPDCGKTAKVRVMLVSRLLWSTVRSPNDLSPEQRREPSPGGGQHTTAKDNSSRCHIHWGANGQEASFGLSLGGEHSLGAQRTVAGRAAPPR